VKQKSVDSSENEEHSPQEENDEENPSETRMKTDE
jgi:hypothetical protein